jgi:PmbA protein
MLVNPRKAFRRLGKLEDVERSESEHIGLRVFVGRRSATIGSSDMSDAALASWPAARWPWPASAPETMRACARRRTAAAGAARRSGPDRRRRTHPQQLRAAAEEAEDAARAVAGVTNSEGGSAGSGGAVMALATSHGFAGAYAATSGSLSASVVAGEAERRAARLCRAPGPSSRRLLAPAEIGRTAGFERAWRGSIRGG